MDFQILVMADGGLQEGRQRPRRQSQPTADVSRMGGRPEENSLYLPKSGDRGVNESREPSAVGQGCAIVVCDKSPCDKKEKLLPLRASQPVQD